MSLSSLKKKIGRLKYWPLMWLIQILRHFCRQDCYLVAGQLHSRNTDPIDSWQFFCWLQQQQIPSRYVVNQDDEFYLRDKLRTRDFLVLKHGVTDLLHHVWLMAHTRAFVAEWNVEVPFMNRWLHDLSYLQYVMLQHGISGLWSDALFMQGLKPFNTINVSSAQEANFLDARFAPEDRGRCMVAGLPRYELIHDETSRESHERILFIMFTWRNRQGGMTWQQFCQSVYWQEITRLLNQENVERLTAKGIKVVMALHHSLLRTVADIRLSDGITIVGTEEVSYWIRHAHILLTDFSSVSFDFLFQQKPVIYWIPDQYDPSLDPKDMGYGSKVLSAIQCRKEFFNTADNPAEVFDLLDYYHTHDYQLEPDKEAIAFRWMTRKTDFSRKVYEGIEAIIQSNPPSRSAR